MHKAFYLLYLFFQKNRMLFFSSLTLLFVILGFFAIKIKFDEDISKFIPKNQQNETLTKILETTKFDDNIILNFQKTDIGTAEDLTQFASQLLDSLNGNSSQYIMNIQGYVEDESAFKILDFAYDFAPLFLNDADYDSLDKRLSKDTVASITRANYKALISPSGIISKDLILKDPLKISLLALKNLNPLGFNDNLKLKNNFLVTNNEKNLLLFITPSKQFNNESLVQDLTRLKTNIAKAYKNKVELQFYGGAFIAEANAKQIKKDVYTTVGIAVACLLLLFILFYRKITIPIILIIPTIFGGLMGLLILYFVRSEVSAISLGIGSILLGVTLDYSIHILTHIRNGSKIKALYKNIAKPILLSGLTTALAFLCLLFIDSQALQDLGIFASVSVIISAVFALIFIPQAYKLKSNNPGLSLKQIHSKKTFLDKFAAYKFQDNKLIILLILALLLLSTYTYNKVMFNKDLSSLNFIPNDIRDAENNLDALTNTASKTVYIASYGENVERVMETNDSVAKVLQALQNKTSIKSYNSLSTFLKAEKNQLKKIRKWNSFWDAQNRDSIKDILITSGKQIGFNQNAFNRFYRYLCKDFQSLNRKDFNEMGVFNLNNYISTTKSFSTITTIVKADDDQINNLESAFASTNNVVVIDRQAVNESLLGDLKSDFNSLIIYCLIAVIGLLLLVYRNLKLTLVTVVPIVITWFITIGIMGFFGLKFNIFNIIVSSFIFGLGVDYSIFITNGLLSDSSKDSREISTNKTSIVLSVITTILGIGVLIFAQHPALRSLALISIIGIVTAMLISFTIQPLLFNLVYRIGKN